MNRRRLNAAIRQYMKNQVGVFGAMSSKDLVEITKLAFPAATSKQIAGNLSAVCCYYNELNYDFGIVSSN